jgi:hypothetical protein
MNNLIIGLNLFDVNIKCFTEYANYIVMNKDLILDMKENSKTYIQAFIL